MATSEKTVRRSLSLPTRLARRVGELAKARCLSANRLLVGLIEQGLDAQERERQRFFTLAEELVHSKDPREQQRLKEELAKMTFGS